MSHKLVWIGLQILWGVSRKSGSGGLGWRIREDSKPQTSGLCIYTAGYPRLAVDAQLWVLDMEWITHIQDTTSAR